MCANEVIPSSTELSVYVNELQPDTTYDCCVSAVNIAADEGPIACTTVRTLQNGELKLFRNRVIKSKVVTVYHVLRHFNTCTVVELVVILHTCFTLYSTICPSECRRLCKWFYRNIPFMEPSNLSVLH